MGTVQLVDFGNAGRAPGVGAPSPTRQGEGADAPPTAVVRGTPQFMSPAAASHGSSQPSDDLWSLGAVTLFLLTGRPPWMQKPQPEGTKQAQQPQAMEPEAVLATLRSGNGACPRVPKSIVAPAQDFIRQCFHSQDSTAGSAQPSTNAAKLMQHAWLVGALPPSVAPPAARGASPSVPSAPPSHRNGGGVRRSSSTAAGGSGFLPQRSTSVVLPPSGRGLPSRSSFRRVPGIAMGAEHRPPLLLPGDSDSSSDEEGGAWGGGMRTLHSGATPPMHNSASIGIGSARDAMIRAHSGVSERSIQEHSGSASAALHLASSNSGPLSGRVLTAPSPGHVTGGGSQVPLGPSVASIGQTISSGRYSHRANTGMSVQFTQVLADAISMDTDGSTGLPDKSSSSATSSSHAEGGSGGPTSSPALAPLHVRPFKKHSPDSKHAPRVSHVGKAPAVRSASAQAAPTPHGRSASGAAPVVGIATGKRRVSGVALPSSPTEGASSGQWRSQHFPGGDSAGVQAAVTPVPSDEGLDLRVTPLTPPSRPAHEGASFGTSQPAGTASPFSGQGSAGSPSNRLPPVRIHRNADVGSAHSTSAAARQPLRSPGDVSSPFSSGVPVSSIATNDGFVVQSSHSPAATAAPQASLGLQAGGGLTSSLAGALVGANSMLSVTKHASAPLPGASGGKAVVGGGAGGVAMSAKTSPSSTSAPRSDNMGQVYTDQDHGSPTRDEGNVRSAVLSNGGGAASPQVDPSSGRAGAASGHNATRVLSSASQPGPVHGNIQPVGSDDTLSSVQHAAGAAEGASAVDGQSAPPMSKSAGTLGFSGLWHAAKQSSDDSDDDF